MRSINTRSSGWAIDFETADKTGTANLNRSGIVEFYFPIAVSTKTNGGHGNGEQKSASKRELIDTGKDQRYVRRDDRGQFKASDDMGVFGSGRAEKGRYKGSTHRGDQKCLS